MNEPKPENTNGEVDKKESQDVIEKFPFDAHEHRLLLTQLMVLATQEGAPYTRPELYEDLDTWPNGEELLEGQSMDDELGKKYALVSTGDNIVAEVDLIQFNEQNFMENRLGKDDDGLFILKYFVRIPQPYSLWYCEITLGQHSAEVNICKKTPLLNKEQARIVDDFVDNLSLDKFYPPTAPLEVSELVEILSATARYLTK